MNALPEWIVLLWFFPATVSLVFPLILLILWLAAKGPGRLMTLQAGSRDRKAHAEKRAYRRIHSDELLVDVSDGVELASALACNVSQGGICIMGIPKKGLGRADQLAVVVDNRGESYALHVTPRWQKNLESGRQIGASIEYAPDGWYEFVKKSSGFAAA